MDRRVTVAAGGALAGGVTGLAVRRTRQFAGRTDSSSGGTGESGVVKVGPGLDPGIPERMVDFFLLDVLGGVPLLAFVLVGAVLAVVVFTDTW